MSPTKPRILHILKYLWQNTDETHYATVADITAHLNENGISGNRKTIADDIQILIDFGFDIICIKSRQNQCFIGSRILELPELKLLVDAVQASNFITRKKSKALIEKLTALTSVHTAGELHRSLYMDGRVKPGDESAYYTVDLLHNAISQKRRISFRYYEYNGQKKKVFKHSGQVYDFSPYHLIWSNDSYYVLGYSESHEKIVTFRIDRMERPGLTDKPYHPEPEDFDVATHCNAVFSMYDSDFCTVTLQCENSVMKAIVDKFGTDVQTEPLENNCFKATVDVYASPTFFGWVCTYGGKIRIINPANVAESYRAHIKSSLENA